ncbi:uncharacterized protein FA14DRAFT_181816 [Meira miltonrushii]|uniref:Uncharacterized protein n=1 Tax=Meira miltonrushii TaxID=1280837 RepID=A0A316V2W1_9BASI|nr:uncharacterized protein FA14DRAFT_181816 [Meira miltonrushii]PWN31896.1 hypothetical protein FA14DRAFT_181816 [Meira miltonrushii]
MGMMIKFRSRQPNSCQTQSTTNCESSSTASTSSQPHSPASTGPSLPSPSMSSFSSNGVLSSDSPTLKSGFEPEQKPKAGILVHNSLSTLCYRPASAEETSSINRMSSYETQEDVENRQGDVWCSAQAALRESQRPSSHSDLPSLRFDETEYNKQHQRNPSKSIYQNKHVAYATVFDGSIVRRREITTPSSTNSHQPSPRGSPSSGGCEPLPNTSTASYSPTTSSPPQYEYSRIYYSNGNSQKRKGLRGILAR